MERRIEIVGEKRKRKGNEEDRRTIKGAVSVRI